MKITRENYEAYLVDFAEGNLSEDMMQEVQSFLVLNPDIQEEFELFTDATVETVNVSFEGKENLKKIPFEKTSSTSDFFQQLCVAHVEGLNSENDEKFLHDLIAQDIDKEKELQLFEKTKLIVEDFNYNEKLTLKQSEIIHHVNHSNFEEYCIACMEGWLDQKGLIALNDFIAANPKQKKVLDLYYSTRLKPNLSIVYPDKRKIKRFNILSPTFKKYGSIISSAAAILVFAFMVFYTTTVDDTTQLTSSVVQTDIQNTENSTKTITESTSESEVDAMKSKKITNDPFGFKKLNGNVNNMESLAANNRVFLNPVEPKKIDEVDCQPCKQLYNYKPLVRSISVVNDANIQLAENTEQPSNKKAAVHAKKFAKAGLKELGRITNTELKVEKDKQGDRTKIAFNSKYFSFATQVNKNKN